MYHFEVARWRVRRLYALLHSVHLLSEAFEGGRGDGGGAGGSGGCSGKKRGRREGGDDFRHHANRFEGASS